MDAITSLLETILAILPFAGGIFIAVVLSRAYPEAPEYMFFAWYALGYLVLAVPAKHDLS